MRVPDQSSDILRRVKIVVCLVRGSAVGHRPRFDVKPLSDSDLPDNRTALQVQIDVIAALLLREVQSRFGRSRVGFIWALVEPITHVVVPVVLFGYIFARTIPGLEYPVFLLYGFLPFVLFKNICLQTMAGVQANRGLLAYRQVHLLDVFMARATSNVVVEVMLFAIVFSGLALLGFDVLPERPIEVIVVMALAVLMGLGLGMLLAAVCSFIPDARTVIRIAFAPMYLISGVIYPISRFPTEVVEWLSLNPLVHLIEFSRASALANYRPIDTLNMNFPVATSAIVLFAGLALYRLRALNRVTM
jgi:capsular polysaccharide transport system permease protein